MDCHQNVDLVKIEDPLLPCPYSQHSTGSTSRLLAGKCSPRYCESRATGVRCQFRELGFIVELYRSFCSPPRFAYCLLEAAVDRSGPLSGLSLAWSVIQRLTSKALA